MTTPSSSVRPPAPTVRPATADDAAAIATVRTRGWQSGYAGIMPAAVLDALRPEVSPSLAHRLTNPRPDSPCLVAERDGAVVGFVTAGPYRIEQHPDVLDPSLGGEIYAIYVDPDHWRSGAGAALLPAAVDRLHAAGLAPVRLWVLTDNARARRFYESYGFAPDGAHEPFTVSDGTRVDELRYRLD